MTRPRKLALWLVGILVLLWAALIICGGIWVPGADILFYLAVGWTAFLYRVIPQIHVRWDLVGSTIVYAIVLIAGSHLFLGWLYREMGHAGGASAKARWRWRWTVSGFLLVVLMFTAGIAAIGVVHQTTWLVRSPQRLYRSHVSAARMKCASNLKQIGLALLVYSNDHGGKLPDDFSVLLIQEDLYPAVFNCPESNDVPASGSTPQQIAEDLKKPGHCSYLYFGKGLKMPLDDRTVLAAEPLENHDGDGINVLYADGTVDWVDGDKAEALLQKLRSVGAATTGAATAPATKP